MRTGEVDGCHGLPSSPASSSISSSSSSSSCVGLTMRSSCFVRVAHSCDGCGESGGCRYELGDTIGRDVGLIYPHGGSSSSYGGESSLIWWEGKGRLSGRQDGVMVAKKCRALKVERHRDKNKVTILGTCVVQVHCRILRGWGWGRCAGCRVRGAGCVRTVRVCVRPGTRFAFAGE
jgi:hypothetical protein